MIDEEVDWNCTVSQLHSWTMFKIFVWGGKKVTFLFLCLLVTQWLGGGCRDVGDVGLRKSFCLWRFSSDSDWALGFGYIYVRDGMLPWCWKRYPGGVVFHLSMLPLHEGTSLDGDTHLYTGCKGCALCVDVLMCESRFILLSMFYTHTLFIVNICDWESKQ